MPRRRHARELEPSRVAQWVKSMSEVKLVPGYGELDMQDPESIRTYVRHALALNEPTGPGLKRLEMLLEVAGALPQAKTAAAAPISLEQARAASAELMRRKMEKQREQ
jgi:hypothetical protein